jgi:RNA polymerase sigma factor (sigma-70 family)
MPICAAQEDEPWIVRHEACPPGQVDAARQGIEEQISRAVRRHADSVCRSIPTAGQFDLYVARIWRGLEYHWRRLGESQRMPFRQLLERAEAADLGIGTGKASLVYELTLAQALELNENKAARMFEEQYMPDVRKVAQRAGGQRALDLIDNFAAELIVAAEGRTPKIAKYHGRTFLNLWLRSVVANHCVSAGRKTEPETLIAEPAGGARDTALEVLADRGDCQKLLRPLFKTALESISAEDCVLVKMLSLDGVPQNRVAKSLGIHSGNVTRRRQKATDGIFARLRELAEQRNKEQHFDSCMQTVLAGHDPVLRDWLARLLAGTLGGRASDQQPGGES